MALRRRALRAARSKSALINAASVAGLMLTTDVLITELKEDKDAVEGAVS